MNIALLFFFSFISMSHLNAQDESSIRLNENLNKISLKGRLFERGTKKVISKQNIYLLPLKEKTQTDEKGQFEFLIDENKLKESEEEIKIVVNAPGFIRLDKKIEIPQNTPSLTLYLEREYYDLFTTTVRAQKKKKDQSKKSLTQEEFLKAPGAQEDPVKAIQNLPGVANQAANAQIVIQGSAPDNTLYTLNGHEIPIIFHFGGLSSIVMPQAVEQIDYLASGFGVEYGRVLGGVINLETRSPKKDRAHGMAYVDIFNAGGLYEGPIGEDSSFFIGVRQSYIGEVFKRIAQDMDGFNLTVAPTFSDLFSKFETKINDRLDFNVQLVTSRDRLEFAIEEPINNDPALRGDFFQETNFYRVIPELQYRINATDQLDFSLGYGDNEIFAQVGDNFFDLNSTTLSFRGEYHKQISALHEGFLGLDAQQTEFNVGIRFPQSTSNNGGVSRPPSAGDLSIGRVTGTNQENALYYRHLYKRDKLELSPQLRITNFSQNNETFLLPRVGVNYNLSSSLLVFVQSGLYVQAPQNGEATQDFGNPDLMSEKSSHLSLGFDKDFRGGSSNGTTLRVELFYKDLSDLIIADSGVDQNNRPLRYSNDGSGHIRGAQIMTQWRKDKMALNLSYTYLNSRRHIPGLGSFASEFDQTHNLNLIGQYEEKRWTYSFRFRYVSGNPFTPVESSIFDSDNDVYIPFRGALYSERFDPFIQLDVRVDRKWIYDTWILSAYLDIQNLTNNQNVQSINYNYDYSQNVKTAGLPVLPIFGVRGEF